MKPRMLVLELWGIGDLVLGSDFLRGAADQYEVTLLAQARAKELGAVLWPRVRVATFHAPWTQFRAKYHLHAWPWIAILRILRALRSRRFDVALSARRDPRDHLLMLLSGARRRLGFPRAGSRFFLNRPLDLPSPETHRYGYWQRVADQLGIRPQPLPVAQSALPGGGEIVLHSGAAQPVRVWPLVRYQALARRLRREGFKTTVLCDPDQASWWRGRGESPVECPRSIARLIERLRGARLFIGNDSGPGHLAAALGVPTFTVFGPQLPEWFAPIHPRSIWIKGAPCPHKPCFDACRFSRPHCIEALEFDDIWRQLRPLLKHTRRR